MHRWLLSVVSRYHKSSWQGMDGRVTDSNSSRQQQLSGHLKQALSLMCDYCVQRGPSLHSTMAMVSGGWVGGCAVYRGGPLHTLQWPWWVGLSMPVKSYIILNLINVIHDTVRVLLQDVLKQLRGGFREQCGMGRCQLMVGLDSLTEAKCADG